MQKTYSRVNWENSPSVETPINETNLNKMDYAVNEIDNRVITLDTGKADKTQLNSMVKDISYNEANGVFTITFVDQTTKTIDTKLEKLAVNFTYDAATNELVITLSDGTTQRVSLAALIDTYTFTDSATIDFTETDHSVTAIIKDGSITSEKLNPDYLGQINVSVAAAALSESNAAASATQAQTAETNALASATLSQSYAKGGTGTRAGEDADNAKYYMEQAKAVAKVDIATTEKAGIVKPDGTTITVEADGTIHGAGGTAESISFDNSGTGLEATNVQDALEEEYRGITPQLYLSKAEYEALTDTQIATLMGIHENLEINVDATYKADDIRSYEYILAHFGELTNSDVANARSIKDLKDDIELNPLTLEQIKSRTVFENKEVASAESVKTLTELLKTKSFTTSSITLVAFNSTRIYIDVSYSRYTPIALSNAYSQSSGVIGLNSWRFNGNTLEANIANTYNTSRTTVFDFTVLYIKNI